MLMVLETSPDQQQIKEPDSPKIIEAAPQTPGADLIKMLELEMNEGLSQQFENGSAQQSENHELNAFLMQGCSELKESEDHEDGFKKMKGGFKNREMMMGSTIRDLGNTIKEAKKSKKAGEL